MLSVQKKQQKRYFCYEYEKTLCYEYEKNTKMFLPLTKKIQKAPDVAESCSKRSSTVNICIIQPPTSDLLPTGIYCLSVRFSFYAPLIRCVRSPACYNTHLCNRFMQ